MRQPVCAFLMLLAGVSFADAQTLKDARARLLRGNYGEAQDLYTRWPELDSHEKRKVVEAITEKVIIGKDEVTINLCYLPVSSEIMAAGQHIPKGSLPRLEQMTPETSASFGRVQS